MGRSKHRSTFQRLYASASVRPRSRLKEPLVFFTSPCFRSLFDGRERLFIFTKRMKLWRRFESPTSARVQLFIPLRDGSRQKISLDNGNIRLIGCDTWSIWIFIFQNYSLKSKNMEFFPVLITDSFFLVARGLALTSTGGGGGGGINFCANSAGVSFGDCAGIKNSFL